jgi:hypothetical protein
MNRSELATKLTQKQPRMKAFYVSCYADGVVRDGVHTPLEGGLGFLQKPYALKAVAWKIREILDSE